MKQSPAQASDQAVPENIHHVVELSLARHTLVAEMGGGMDGPRPKRHSNGGALGNFGSKKDGPLRVHRNTNSTTIGLTYKSIGSLQMCQKHILFKIKSNVCDTYKTGYVYVRANSPFPPHPSCLGKINKGIQRYYREYTSPIAVKF